MGSKIFYSILAVVGVLLVMAFLKNDQTGNLSTADADKTINSTPEDNMINQPSSELGIKDEVLGTGDPAVSGDTLTVHYTGKLTDGKIFDSSIPRGTPFEFTIGAGQVIKGWDQGLIGMKVGGKRTLTIPPDLGYGASGQGPIPPSATLIFAVELLKIKH